MKWKAVSAAALAIAAFGAQGATAQPAPARQQPAAAPAAAAAAQLAVGIAADVNGDAISTYDVTQRANLLLVSSGIETPTDELRQRASQQALRDLVDERLQMQEAKEFKVDVTDEEVTRRLADIARQNNTDADGFAASLRQSGVSVATLRDQIKAEMAWSRLMNGLYGTRLRVSEQEVSDTQQRIAQSATRPQYLLSEIFIRAETEQEFVDAQAGAMRLLEEMQRGAPFPLVARQFSSAPSSSAGGDIGWLADAEIQPELQTVVRQLQPGQVSMPVRTQNGLYIVALRDQRAGQAAGANSRVTLRQVTAPLESRQAMERARRRVNGCTSLAQVVANVPGANVVDLGQVAESDLSETVRTQIAEIEAGSAAALDAAGEQGAFFVVCARESAGPGVPSRREIEDRLFDQELAMLSDRYLRNLRREATILTR